MQSSSILLGAGFSANWGTPVITGFTGSLMARMPEEMNDLKLRLIQDQNFEKVLNDLINEGDTERHRAFLSLIVEQFKIIDRAHRSLSSPSNGSLPSWMPSMRRFYGFIKECLTGSLSPVGHEVSYMFSLNQDLLMERSCRSVNDMAISRWRMTRKNTNRSDNLNSSTLGFLYGDKDIEYLVYEEGKPSHGMQLVKLHGSIDWVKGEALQDIGVILGGGKVEQIKENTPLVDSMNVFQKLIWSGGHKLYIHGYSFLDEHINELLYHGIEERDLRIYIHDLNAVNLLKRILNDENISEDKFSKALIGYSTELLGRVIPENNRVDVPAPGPLREFLDA